MHSIRPGFIFGGVGPDTKGFNMNYGEGLISKVFTWIWHPSNSEETLTDWAGFLVLVLIVSFLWSTVIKMAE